MREPAIKFGKTPSSPERTRRTLAECRELLAKTSLSPELREGLKLRVAQLEEELRTGVAPRPPERSERSGRNAD